MMTTSTAPFPYRDPYILNLEPHHSGLQTPLFFTERSLPPAVDFTFVVERQLEIRLTSIPSEIERHGWNAQFSLPARFEFVVTNDAEGMLLFDSLGHLIVHAPTAKLGYDGSGPSLSKNVMRILGVTEETINEIQAETRGKSKYVVIVSREKHVAQDGLEVAIRGHDVLDTWTWWSGV